METKEVFQYEITINVLVSYFRFIWIPMLLVYGGYYIYIFFNSFSAGIDVRFWRLKSVPALQGLMKKRKRGWAYVNVDEMILNFDNLNHLINRGQVLDTGVQK